MAHWRSRLSSLSSPQKTLLFFGYASVLYWLTRLVQLTALPVFADEAIYIRWAQLITHDRIYLFFALNDGKPPLFMWLLLPLLQVIGNPLVAGRVLSALAGYGQLWINDQLVRALGGGWVARIAAATILITSPFWFFHHRLAVMDALLTLCLSSCWLGMLLLHRSLQSKKATPTQWTTLGASLCLTGVAWGAALWTKTPALFLAPIFIGAAYFLPWFESELSFNQTVSLVRDLNAKTLRWFAYRSAAFALTGALGLAIFLLLKLHPAFGSLFGRSSDFSYGISDVLKQGPLIVARNIDRVLPWLAAYLRPELIGLSAIALLVSSKRRLHWWILGSGLVWIAPLLIIGKTLHPRYFLPISLFITVSGALFWEEVWNFLQRQKDNFMPLSIFTVLTGFFLVGSLRFMLLAQFDTNRTPFVPHDREQYLTEWSSGHGLTQVRDRIITEVHAGNRVTVVTEGSFGTLPDGLLMYFDRIPEIQHVRIEGLAQYPVRTLPDWVLADAAVHPTWLLVNEHRLALTPELLPYVTELDRYPRPYGAPALLLLEISPIDELDQQ